MSYEKCLLTFNDATGLSLSEEERKSMMLSMLRARERINKARTKAASGNPAKLPLFEPDEEAFYKAADDLGAQKEAQAKRNKIRTLKNAVIRDKIMDHIAQVGGINNANEAIRGILYGSNKLYRDSIESMWGARRRGWTSVLDNELYKLGAQKAMNKGLMDKDVAGAMWRQSNGESLGNSPAEKVAALYGKVLDDVRGKLNAVGADIKDARDYIASTMHDEYKIRRAGGDAATPEQAFSAWWAKTLPRLSDKNFGDGATPAEKERFGRSVFHTVITHVDAAGGDSETGGYIPQEYQGTSNVAERVSHARTLIWKDADSWLGNMQEFGKYNTLHSTVLMSLDRGARALALMERLGTNPAANLNMILKRIQETYRNADPFGVTKFQDKVEGLQNVMGRLDGSLNAPANMGFSKVATALRTWETMSSLGSVGITHLVSSLPTSTSELAHHGINRLESIGNLFKSLKTGMGDADHRELMADLGAYSDGCLRHVAATVGDDSVPGRVSSFAGKFMDATGVHLVYDRVKAGISDMLAHNLGRNIGKDFADLDPRLQNMLTKYRITADDWASMKGAELPNWNGRAYLTPKSVAHISGELSDKLMSYYSDGAAHGVVTPGARERAMILGGTRPGTVPGEMMRFIAQFKMWPLAAYTQVLEREIYMSLSATDRAWNLGTLVALGIPAGYMRMAISDEVSGKPPRDPRDPATLLAAAAQSGGLGILGDFFFGETSRMASGLIATAGGPVAADADALIHMYNSWREDTDNAAMGKGPHHKNGAYGDIWPDLARFAVKHIPGANLFYVKGALDYMLWYHLYAAASPSWWERSNRRLIKDQGRTMTGYTPGGGVPFGVPGLYLGNNSGQSAGLLGNGQLK